MANSSSARSLPVDSPSTRTFISGGSVDQYRVEGQRIAAEEAADELQAPRPAFRLP